jgi:hypothetical protein
MLKNFISDLLKNRNLDKKKIVDAEMSIKNREASAKIGRVGSNFVISPMHSTSKFTRCLPENANIQPDKAKLSNRPDDCRPSLAARFCIASKRFCSIRCCCSMLRD